MPDKLKIGMWGLDTTHATAFTRLCNEPTDLHHVKGMEVVKAFPGESPGFELSTSRVKGFTRELRDDFGIQIVDTPEALLDGCDGFMLESVDGRRHREAFEVLAAAGKPVYVDKPFAASATDARAMLEAARARGIALFSASALRYAESVVAAAEKGEVVGADLHGPMTLVPELPGYFWYGVHLVEMLQGLLGEGCCRVRAVVGESQELLQLEWADGRLANIRGKRAGDKVFGGTAFHPEDFSLLNSSAETVPFYALLLRRVADFFISGKPPLMPEALFEVVAIMEAANASRESGEWQAVERL